MKRPFDARLENSLQVLEQTKENLKFYFDQNDKILVWVVGFSIASIALIISNISSITEVYSVGVLKTTLLLFIISTITGIIYRYAALYSLKYFNSIYLYLEKSFSEEKSMPIDAHDIDGNETIMEIHHLLQYNFNQTYPQILNYHENVNSMEEKEKCRSYLLNEYFRLVKWAKEEHDYANKYVDNIFIQAFGISKSRLNKIYIATEKYSSFLKIYERIARISIVLCLLSFISALAYLVISFYRF